MAAQAMTRDVDRCPDPETIAAYLDGRLQARERSIVAAHLAVCQDCYFIFTEAAQTRVDAGAIDAARPAHTASMPTRRVWWTAVAGAMAAAAAVWIVVGTNLVDRWRGQPELQALVAAVGGDRTVEGRLTGGFAYGPLRGVVRSGEPSTASLSPDVRIAAARIEKAAANNRTPQTLHALGTAYLVLGDPNRAVTTLEEVADATKDDARVLSDLSVAYLARAVRSSQPQDFAKALTTAERATHADPKLPEPWFNRADALEHLSVTDQAKRAWQDYLKVDSTSGWADEARRRLRALEATPDATAVDPVRGALAAAVARGLSESDATWFAKQSPETVRSWTEAQLLEEWPRRVLAGQTDEARALLVHLQPLAAAVLRERDDAFFSDAIRSALQASKGQESVRALAEAHRRYRTADANFASDRIAEMSGALVEAIAPLDAAGSPYALSAKRYRAIGLYYHNDFDAVLAEIGSIEAAARAGRYPRLLGFAYRLDGLTHIIRGEYADGLDAYGAALAAFRSAADAENEAGIQTSLAEGLQFIGETSRSWAARQAALTLVGSVRDPIGRYRIFEGASQFALREELPEVALHFQNAALEDATRAGRPPALITAHLTRATIHTRLSELGPAADDLREAQRLLPSIHDPVLLSRNEARVQLARGEALETSEPTTAIAALDQALAAFGRSGTSWPLASAYLARGRAHTRLRRDDLAEADFQAGIDVFERMRSRVTSESLRTSYFEQPWDLFTEMVRLQVDRGDGARGLAFAEQARARTLLEAVEDDSTATPAPPSRLQAMLPPDVTVLYYASLDDRLLIWVLKATGLQLRVASTRQADIARLVERWRADAANTPQPEMLAAMYDAAIRPVEQQLVDRGALVVVPDGVLHGVPFAALIRRETGRHLIEDHAVVTAPSLTILERSVHQVRQRGARLARALVLGNPRVDSGGAALPDAGAEAREIALLYPERQLLTDADATKARFVNTAGDYDVVHFAGHGLSNDEYPALSRLLLAGDDESSRSLFAREIGTMRFRRTQLVVLAACRTSAGRIRRGEGVFSLARPFIAAGVPTVIASLSDVDDRATHALFVAFHRALRDGASVAEALRSAQLIAVASRDAVVRNPANWASFAVIGGLPALGRSGS